MLRISFHFVFRIGFGLNCVLGYGRAVGQQKLCLRVACRRKILNRASVVFRVNLKHDFEGRLNFNSR